MTGENNTIHNTGTINTEASSVLLSNDINGSSITNSGNIISIFGDAIDLSSATVGNSVSIFNEYGGIISGSLSSNAILGGDNDTSIYNYGDIISSISLGGGNDNIVMYSNSNVYGDIDAGGGNNNLIFSGSGNYDSGIIQNFSTVTKQDAGDWVLGSNSDLDNVTDLNIINGSLISYGDIDVNNINISNGATININSTVNADITNSGILTSSQNANINGNLIQDTDGTLLSDISNNGSSTININGTADLDGILNINKTSENYVTGSEYNLLTASSGLSGHFTSVSGDYINIFRRFAISYSDNDVYAVVAGNYQDIYSNDNQKEIGKYFDLTYENASGDYLAIINSLNSLSSTEQVKDAYNDLGGEIHAAALGIANISGDKFIDSISSNLHTQRIGNIKYQYDSGTAPKKWKVSDVWWRNYKSGLDSKMTNSQIGYTGNVNGNIIGTDLFINDDFIFGAALNQSKTLVNGNEDNLTLDSLGMALYTVYNFKHSYIDTTLAYSLDSYSIDRNINFSDINRNANSSYNGNQIRLKSDMGYIFSFSRDFYLSPNAGLEYANINSDNFNESGAGSLNITGENKTFQSLKPSIGLRAYKYMTLNGMVMMPMLKLDYAFETLDRQGEYIGSLNGAQGTNQFKIEGFDTDYSTIKLSAGIDAKISENSKVYFQYKKEFNENYNSDMIYFGLKVDW